MLVDVQKYLLTKSIIWQFHSSFSDSLVRCFLVGLSVIFRVDSKLLCTFVSFGAVVSGVSLVCGVVIAAYVLDSEQAMLEETCDRISAMDVLCRIMAEYFSVLVDAWVFIIFFTKHVITVLLMASSMAS